MKGRTIYCYGDSNTWGFDSRSFVGERYPREIRWTGILEKKSGCKVVNDGMNGRKIPVNAMQTDFLAGHIRENLRLEDTASLELLIMLGTNDLLTNPRGGARDAAAKMERFLELLANRLDKDMNGDLTEHKEKSLLDCGDESCLEDMRESVPERPDEGLAECRQPAAAENRTAKIRLISPPLLRRGAWVETDDLVEQSRLLGGEFRQVAEKYGIAFTDAGAWDIPLLYDGVHFSEEGHRSFAEELLKIL